MQDRLISSIREAANDPISENMWSEVTDNDGKPIVIAPNPSLSHNEIIKAEEQLGFKLPELLRRIYLEVGNGGTYGPGYGFMKLDFTNNADIQNAFTAFEMTSPYFPFCYWGCTLFSILDLNTGRVGLADVGEHVLGDRAENTEIIWQKNSLREWLEAWLKGEELG